MITIADRAAGAVIGALIGDALALGPHWYYDLEELRQAYGDWISDYTNPKPGRYHSGMHAGELDQTGLLIAMLLRSVVENGTYVEEDFTRRVDEELFPHLDGTPMQGPGGTPVNLSATHTAAGFSKRGTGRKLVVTLILPKLQNGR
jgi:ADP-ribosylglycohydrolase